MMGAFAADLSGIDDDAGDTAPRRRARCDLRTGLRRRRRGFVEDVGKREATKSIGCGIGSAGTHSGWRPEKHLFENNWPGMPPAIVYLLMPTVGRGLAGPDVLERLVASCLSHRRAPGSSGGVHGGAGRLVAIFGEVGWPPARMCGSRGVCSIKCTAGVTGGPTPLRQERNMTATHLTLAVVLALALPLPTASPLSQSSK